MNPSEQTIFQTEFQKQIAQEIQRAKMRRLFYSITGKTHLQFLLYWKRKYEVRFPVFNEEHWVAYFKRRVKFIDMVCEHGAKWVEDIQPPANPVHQYGSHHLSIVEK